MTVYFFRDMRSYQARFNAQNSHNGMLPVTVEEIDLGAVISTHTVEVPMHTTRLFREFVDATLAAVQQ